MTMQPDQMRATRQSLHMTQQELADAIGMSRKAIVEMEAGRAPIEKRTMLALRYLTDTAPFGALVKAVQECEAHFTEYKGQGMAPTRTDYELSTYCKAALALVPGYRQLLPAGSVDLD